MARPGIITRAKVAWHVFHNGLTPRAQFKAAPYVWPSWKQDQPEWHLDDFASYVGEGFNLNSLIYSAIMFKVRSISQAPLRAYVGELDQREPLPADDDLAKLVSRPNANQSWSQFQGLNTAYLNIAGNCYIVMDRPTRSGTPTAMYSLRPDRVFILPRMERGKPGIMGYLYVPEGKAARDGVPILPQDMMHVKLPNPGDPLEGMGYGLSPLSPLARSADVDNQVTIFLKEFFERGLQPNVWLGSDTPLSTETVAEIRERWQEIYGGVEGWLKPAVVDQGGSVNRLGWTFDELGFETIDERNESRILGPFGVPPILIGTRVGLARSTYANYETARRACWEDTLIPELRLFETAYQYYLQGDAGEFVAFDLSNVPALQRDVPQLTAAAFQMWQMGVPANQAFTAVGMDVVGDIPGGDTGYISMALIPAGSTRTRPAATQTPASATEDERGGGKALMAVKTLSEEQKAAHWKAIDAVSRSWEERFGDGAAKAFEADRRYVLAQVKKAQSKALEAKATVDWLGMIPTVAEYLAGASLDGWRKVFAPMVRGIVTGQGERWALELGLQFDVANLFAQEWYDDYLATFAQPINDTSNKAIVAILQQGQEEGWSIPMMQERLGQTFEQWMDGDLSAEDFAWLEDRMPAYRRELISRTETCRSSNAGTNALFGEWGVEQREWLATRDDRVRDTHAEADGQVRGLEEAFSVGGYEMMYPGDASMGAPPEEFVSCRCTIMPVIG